MVFSQLELSGRRPKQRRNFRGSHNRRCPVAGVHARLQLADPVPARTDGQLAIVFQMSLEATLVKLRIVE